MERLYLYTGSLIFIGFSLGTRATIALLTGDSGLPLWLLAIGGIGMILTAAYQAVTTDPQLYDVRRIWVLGLVFAALISLFGLLLQLLG